MQIQEVGAEENEAWQGEECDACLYRRAEPPDPAGRRRPPRGRYGAQPGGRVHAGVRLRLSDARGATLLRDFAVAWRARGGKLAAVFREPWARFKSNYERDFGDLAQRLVTGKLYSAAFSEAAYNASLTATIGDYGARDFRDTPMGHHAKTWGAINRPNYYVRLLNGLDLPHADAPSKREVANLTEAHLAAAIDLIDSVFTHVFLLDGDVQIAAQHDLIGRNDTAMTQTYSNNPYSTQSTKATNQRNKPDAGHIAKPPDTGPYRAAFEAANCLDAPAPAFYGEAVRARIAARGACAGCAGPAPPFASCPGYAVS